MAEKLEFDLSVKNNDLQKALEKASSSASTLSSYFAGGQKPMQELTNEINKASKATSFASDFMEQFKTQTLGVAAGQFVFQALSSAIQFVTKSIEDSIAAYSEQEDALNKLGQALNATGDFSQSAVDGVSAFASQLESVSKFSDDAIIAQVAFLKSLGATTDQAKQLVLAAANLSATLGGSLEENTDKLGKTLSGTSGRLAQYIPELKSLTEEQLKAGEAARIINEKWGGAAANDLKTYSGQITNLSNAFNNIQETIGGVIVKSDLYQGTLKDLKKFIDNLNTSVSVADVSIQNASGGYATSSKTVEQYANDIVLLDTKIKQLTEYAEANRNKISAIAPGVAVDITADAKRQIEELTKLRADIEEKLLVGRKSTPRQAAEQAKTPDEQTAKEIEANKKRNAEILSLDQQLALERSNFATQSENQKIENELAQQSAELERIAIFNAKKVEIDAQKNLTNAEETLKGEELRLEKLKINAEKELALQKINDDKKLGLQKANIKARQDGEKAMTDFEKKQALDRENIQRATLSTIATLSSESNKTLAAIGKAAALTQIAIDGPAAVVNAYKNIPAPLNIPAAAAVAAAVAVQAAKVSGVNTSKFENGGIVGATMGPDNRIAQVRDGEMVLNANQQKNLFDMINRGAGSGDVVVNIDGREVFRAVRNQLKSGMSFA